MALASTSSSASLPASPASLLAPAYILRAHTAQISSLAFSSRRNYLYSGDIDGWVGVWDLRTFRPVYFWKAHEGGVLTLADWQDGLLR
jgi:WD40 repeat protein